mmetsp:Transcript_26295/g.55960  ORF Transcript_26295/g.55960 Transcript_26295/m.55960 type:complete len:231 (+) Transcript_26295:36-728(+)
MSLEATLEETTHLQGEGDLDSFFSGEYTPPKPVPIGKSNDPSGTMDSKPVGEALPSASQVNALLKLLKVEQLGVAGIFRTAQQHLGNLKPWKEFMLPISNPGQGETCTRLTQNVTTYRTNYLVIFFLVAVLMILRSPSSVACIGIMAVVWVWFLKKNEDTEWKPVVAGIEMGPTMRTIAMTLVTALVVLGWLGQTLFSAFFFSACAAGLHGIMHKPPEAEEDFGLGPEGV